MRSVTRIGSSNGDRFLSLNDYENTLSILCKENEWEYAAFRDYVFFDKDCFNIEDRQKLKSDLELRKLSLSKLNQFALTYNK